MGLDPKEHLLIAGGDDQLAPLGHEELCKQIEVHQEKICMVYLSGVHYLTGQAFRIKEITELCHNYNIVVGLDLAHAAGNIELKLHDWQVDFAAWCSYKYLNCGPGNMAGLFVHERHLEKSLKEVPRFAGWWGHDKENRFQMQDSFRPMKSAESWQLSNPSIISMASMRDSLDIFARAGGMEKVRKKAEGLTEMLLNLLEQEMPGMFELITPREKEDRGSMLCLRLLGKSAEQSMAMVQQLEEQKIYMDFRTPDIVRLTPAPLYTHFEDLFHFVIKLKKVASN